MVASKSTSGGIAITEVQVKAAARVHAGLAHWSTSDAALALLKSRVAGFSAEASLLKTVTLNELYATKMLATGRMARHITKIMAGPKESGPKLIEKIAALQDSEGNVPRVFTSFAAKFCHFFVDDGVYPIYDAAAGKALRLHLGSGYRTIAGMPYREFRENFLRLVEPLAMKFKYREMDRYLWLTGMYMRWLERRVEEAPRINQELMRFFEDPGQRATDLDKMLPSCLERTFRC